MTNTGGMKLKRKLIIGILSLLLTLGVAGTFWGTNIAVAAAGIWNSCPRDRVNCAYPGDCHSYIDTNKDTICDRSQAEPAAITSPSSSSSSQSSTTMTTIAAENDTDPAVTSSNSASLNSRSYHFLPILAILAVLYATTWMLSGKKIIKQVLHRRIWNIVLGVSALVSVLLGMLLLLNLDLGWSITLPFSMLYWHVEAGIAMGLIAIFHVGWHWRYFTKLFTGK
jgi:hypothetical protein